MDLHGLYGLSYTNLWNWWCLMDLHGVSLTYIPAVSVRCFLHLWHIYIAKMMTKTTGRYPGYPYSEGQTHGKIPSPDTKPGFLGGHLIFGYTTVKRSMYKQLNRGWSHFLGFCCFFCTPFSAWSPFCFCFGRGWVVKQPCFWGIHLPQPQVAETQSRHCFQIAGFGCFPQGAASTRERSRLAVG